MRMDTAGKSAAEITPCPPKKIQRIGRLKSSFIQTLTLKRSLVSQDMTKTPSTHWLANQLTCRQMGFSGFTYQYGDGESTKNSWKNTPQYSFDALSSLMGAAEGVQATEMVVTPLCDTGRPVRGFISF